MRVLLALIAFGLLGGGYMLYETGLTPDQSLSAVEPPETDRETALGTAPNGVLNPPTGHMLSN